MVDLNQRNLFVRLQSFLRVEGDMYGQDRELELANATNAILISLLRSLLAKGVLSNGEVRALLTQAVADLGPHEYTAPVKGAIGVILNDILAAFPENGGD